MAKKGKEFNKENVIQTLRNHFELNWDDRAKELNKLDNPDTYTGEQLRSYCRKKENADWYAEFKRIKGSHSTLSQYDMHRNTDLSFTNKIKSLIIQGVTITEDIILDVAGMDKDEWKVDDHVKFNEWPTPMDGEAFYNFQFRVSFSKRSVMDMNPTRLTEMLAGKVKPVHPLKLKHGNGVLIIPLADLHFGVTKIEHLRVKIEKIKDFISSGFDTIVIEQLGDMFHSAFMTQSQTVRGTILEDVDMPQAVEDAKTFFEEIVTTALSYSNDVRYEYAIGNHSELEYIFNEYLKVRYPELQVNNHNTWRMAYKVGKVGVMLSHGHTVKLKDLPLKFAKEYKDIFFTTDIQEIHTGHRHTFDKEIEVDGVILRQFGTTKKADAYETKNGWTNARKVIQLISYSEDGDSHLVEIKG